jgi:hypothetical protein
MPLPSLFEELQKTPVQPGEPEPKHHYQPTKEYHPTFIAVRCSKCGLKGHVVFEGGFPIAQGDRLMEGRVIRGSCPACGPTELIPCTHVPESIRQKFWIDWKIEEEMRSRLAEGLPIDDGGIMYPKARRDEHARARSGSVILGPTGEPIA